jgi:DNA-binding transcriptional LysR family regulator
LNPQLEAFLAVAAHNSMHGAARSVHVSQTAITQRIHLLESKLETTLFIRTRKGVYLTPEGESLLRYCNTVSDLSGEALANIMGAGSKTAIRICISGPTSIMTSRVIPQCLTVMKKFPQLLITFDVNDTDHRVNSLRTGASQFAILEPENAAKEMEVKSLRPEKYHLVCSKLWKNRSLREIIESERIIDFDEGDPMSFNYLKHFNLLKLAQAERLFVNRTGSLAKMIVEGYGYGVLTEEFSQAYVDADQLMTLNSGKKYENPLVLAWYARPEPPKYFLSLIKAIS